MRPLLVQCDQKNCTYWSKNPRGLFSEDGICTERNLVMIKGECFLARLKKTKMNSLKDREGQTKITAKRWSVRGEKNARKKV